MSAIVDDVDHVQRLAVLAMFADVIEHLFHRPILVNRDEVGRHEAADASLRITEKRLRNAPLVRREQFDQLAGRRARHFLQQRGAIVRRHLVQNGHDLFVGHCVQELLLRIHIEIFEDVGRERVR